MNIKKDSLQEGKEISYYSNLVQAWISTKMEKDKSLLALSAGGIGLLVTLLTTSSLKENWIIFLYISAIVSFIIVLISTIIIFDKNAELLKNEIKDDREHKADQQARHDRKRAGEILPLYTNVLWQTDQERQLASQ